MNSLSLFLHRWLIPRMTALSENTYLASIGQALTGRLLMLDGRSMEWTQVRMPRKADCLVCKSN